MKHRLSAEKTSFMKLTFPYGTVTDSLLEQTPRAPKPKLHVGECREDPRSYTDGAKDCNG